MNERSPHENAPQMTPNVTLSEKPVEQEYLDTQKARAYAAELIHSSAFHITEPWKKVPETLIQDPAIIKIETGSEGAGLIFESRESAKEKGTLVGSTSSQVYVAYKKAYEHVFDQAHDPEFVTRIREAKGFALGDNDMGAIFTLWLLKNIQEGKDITQYENLVRFVGAHDRHGRISLYPKGESPSSLVMTNWGIMLSAENDEEKIAHYLSVFDHLTEHPEHLHEGIPAISETMHTTLTTWLRESAAFVENAEVCDDYIVCRDATLSDGSTRWDEVTVEGHRKYDGKKAIITIAKTNAHGSKEIQISLHGAIHFPQFAAFLKKKHLSPWYGEGYIGLNTNSAYTEEDLIHDYDTFLTEHPQYKVSHTAFEMAFTNADDGNEVLNDLTPTPDEDRMPTPEAYQMHPSYAWEEFPTLVTDGTANAAGAQIIRHTVPHHDQEVLSRYLGWNTGKALHARDTWVFPLIKAKAHGKELSLEDIRDATLKVEYGGSLDPQDVQTMRSMYSHNQRDTGAHDDILASFDERVTDPQARFYIFRWKGEIEGFIAFHPSTKREGVTHVSAFNVRPGVHGYTIGDLMEKVTISREARTHVLDCESYANLPISSKYIETGWVAERTFTEPGKREGTVDTLLDLIRDDEHHSVYWSKGEGITREQIVRREHVPHNVIIVSADTQAELPFAKHLDGEHVLTRMFKEPSPGRRYFAVFEPYKRKPKRQTGTSLHTQATESLEDELELEGV